MRVRLRAAPEGVDGPERVGVRGDNRRRARARLRAGLALAVAAAELARRRRVHLAEPQRAGAVAGGAVRAAGREAVATRHVHVVAGLGVQQRHEVVVVFQRRGHGRKRAQVGPLAAAPRAAAAAAEPHGAAGPEQLLPRDVLAVALQEAAPRLLPGGARRRHGAARGGVLRRRPDPPRGYPMLMFSDIGRAAGVAHGAGGVHGAPLRR